MSRTGDGGGRSAIRKEKDEGNFCGDEIMPNLDFHGDDTNLHMR